MPTMPLQQAGCIHGATQIRSREVSAISRAELNRESASWMADFACPQVGLAVLHALLLLEVGSAVEIRQRKGTPRGGILHPLRRRRENLAMARYGR
eukprot:633722-Pleurochrysis_carterae.AAC.2